MGEEFTQKSDSFKISLPEKNFGGVTNFLKNKKVQIVITLILFSLILISSTSMRFAGLPNLKDQTTGKYLFADPDAFYEYRIAETIIENGNISGFDPLRAVLQIPYAQEMLPKTLAFFYSLARGLGSSTTLDYIAVIYPIIAFSLSLIIFFALCWYLSSSKTLALISSVALAYSLSYLQRTGAGISSHEALGMVFLFLALLVYVISLKNYKSDLKKTIFLGTLSGISLAFSFFSWAGGSNFALMIFSFSMLMYYFFGINEDNKNTKLKFILFNFTWIFVSVILMPLFSFSYNEMISRLLSSYGLIGPATLIFMIIDFNFEKYANKIKKFNFEKKKNRFFCSLIATGVVSIFMLLLVGKNPFNFFSNAYIQLLHPFGLERVGLTVAYFSQPYLSDLIGILSKPIFWIFFVGLLLFGFEFGKGIENKKFKNYFYLVWFFSILGIMFSRFSGSSTFNGVTFISKLTYLFSFLVLGVFFLWMYLKEKFFVDEKNIFIFAYMIVMLMSVRSAVRVMFVIMPFVFFIVGYFIVNSFSYAKKKKDGLNKYFFYIASILSFILVVFYLFGNPLTNTGGVYQSFSDSVKYSGPIANDQWQLAMKWVRENTVENSVFVHWWDYGYLVQLLGKRPTLADGGQFQGEFRTHLIGRHVLTETNPERALSFMKSNNVSYLLIDPTDIGKYPAYSKIGSNEKWDRFSVIQSMVSDSSQTVENVNSTLRVYQGTAGVDEDIFYETENEKIFLPGPTYDKIGNPSYKSYVLGTIVEFLGEGSGLSLKQPNVIFVYNNKQYKIPVRYVYYQGQMMDFKSGINSTLMLIPSIVQNSNGGLQTDYAGAMIYLSNKVGDSLFAQVYLMNDPFKKYESIKVVVSEDDFVVKSFEQQGYNIGDIVYFNGIRAPLKIWKVDYSDKIKTNEEFLRTRGEWAEFDNLSFSR